MFTVRWSYDALDDALQLLVRGGEAGIERGHRVQLLIDRAQFVAFGCFGGMGDHGDAGGQQRAHRQHGEDITQLESGSDHPR